MEYGPNQKCERGRLILSVCAMYGLRLSANAPDGRKAVVFVSDNPPKVLRLSTPAIVCVAV